MPGAGGGNASGNAIGRNAPAPILQPSPSVSRVLVTICPPYKPKAKRRTTGKATFRRFREDWNADGTGWAEIHDAVASVERRIDEEGQGWENIAKKLSGETVAGKIESVARAERALHREDPKVITLTVADGVTYTGRPGSIGARPISKKRDLQRRLGHRQRKMIRAYELWHSSARLSWPEIARALGVTVDTMRQWRLEMSNLMGEEALRRSQGDRPRDPETKRFARVVGRESGCGNGREERAEHA